MKTYSAKAADIEKKWVTIDATGLVVGRLASIVAMRLRGKHKASYTPHVDDGDNVIVINAAKAVLTGRKREKKVYHHYTGFIGGIKERTAKAILEGRFPERIVEKAVERMNRLPPGDRGAVEHLAFGKGVLFDHDEYWRACFPVGEPRSAEPPAQAARLRLEHLTLPGLSGPAQAEED